MSERDPAPAAASHPATAGEALRRARERQDLRIETLAASLKVSQAKLELLEADRYDELPGATFTRALAISVCRVLKLDPEPVLARLPLAVTHDLDSVSMGLNEPFRDRGGRAQGSGWRGAVSLQAGAAVLLMLAAAAVYWLPSGLWPRWGRDDVTRVVSSPATQPGVAVGAAPVAPSAQSPAVAATPASSAVSNVEVDTVFSSPAAPQAPGDGPVAGGMLMLRAAAESWVEVRDSAGRILLSRSLAPGEAAGLDGSLPLKVVVGNAEATQVTFRGQPVSLAGTRDNVARLELK
jgi:cytoskeleton protein RodZ